MGIARNNSNILADPIVRALLISLVLHSTFFGVWKLGDSRGWWKQSGMPAWLQHLQKAMTPAPKIMTPLVVNQKQQESQTQLLFVEVDPAQFAEPPKNAKFYGAQSAVAANQKPEKETDAPKIEGRQKEILKITEDSKTKAQPLQPTPKPAPEKQFSEFKPKSQPEKIQPVGDLAFAKPQDKKQNPGEAQQEEQPRPKPRTLAEVQKRSGTLGERMQQEGGVKKLAMSSSLDVKGTAIGDYDARFVEAVRQRWYTLLEQVSGTTGGKVAVEFKLHPDGRITDFKIAQNSVGELQGLICQKAILDPSPYERWPTAMRREMKSDSREVTFTFYYQ